MPCMRKYSVLVSDLRSTTSCLRRRSLSATHSLACCCRGSPQPLIQSRGIQGFNPFFLRNADVHFIAFGFSQLFPVSLHLLPDSGTRRARTPAAASRRAEVAERPPRAAFSSAGCCRAPVAGDALRKRTANLSNRIQPNDSSSDAETPGGVP